MTTMLKEKVVGFVACEVWTCDSCTISVSASVYW